MTSGAPGVQSAAVVVPGGGPAPSTTTASEAPSAEERWTRWLAQGTAQDRRMRERMRYVAALIAAGLMAWLAFAIATG